MNCNYQKHRQSNPKPSILSNRWKGTVQRFACTSPPLLSFTCNHACGYRHSIRWNCGRNILRPRKRLCAIDAYFLQHACLYIIQIQCRLKSQHQRQLRKLLACLAPIEYVKLYAPDHASGPGSKLYFIGIIEGIYICSSCFVVMLSGCACVRIRIHFDNQVRELNVKRTHIPSECSYKAQVRDTHFNPCQT